MAEMTNTQSAKHVPLLEALDEHDMQMTLRDEGGITKKASWRKHQTEVIKKETSVLYFPD